MTRNNFLIQFDYTQIKVLWQVQSPQKFPWVIILKSHTYSTNNLFSQPSPPSQHSLGLQWPHQGDAAAIKAELEHLRLGGEQCSATFSSSSEFLCCQESWSLVRWLQLQGQHSRGCSRCCPGAPGFSLLDLARSVLQMNLGSYGFWGS